MQKIYCFASPHSVAIQSLCTGNLGLLRRVWWWPLPDGSGDVVVCEPLQEGARAALQAMSAEGVTVLPGAHSVVPLSQAHLQLFASLQLPSTITLAELLYEEIESQSGNHAFSPHT